MGKLTNIPWVLAIFIAALSVIVSGGVSQAEVKRYEVKSGTNTALSTYYVYGLRTCDISPPSSYRITRKPRHGNA